MKKAANNLKTTQTTQQWVVRGLNLTAYMGCGPQFRAAYSRALQFAGDPLGQSVLITGEEGTGKQIMARFIHDHSPFLKQKDLFVRADCGAINSGTAKSAFFGHRKWAFSGAGDNHNGYFAEARGGSLFIDEIGNLPDELQPMFLNVVEYHSFRPVGGSHDETSDARLIFATNCDLEKMCKQKEFRSDLYRRIKRLCVHMPALRDCKEDIRPLAAFMIEKYSALYKLNGQVSTHPEVFAMLENYPFPGNIRELDSIIGSALLEISFQPKKVITPDQLILNREETYFNYERPLDDFTESDFMLLEKARRIC